MSAGKKYTLYTVLFYLAFWGLVSLANYYSPSGPCTPGLGAMLFLLSPVVVFVGLFYSLSGWRRGKKGFVGPSIVNIVAVITLVLIFRFS